MLSDIPREDEASTRLYQYGRNDLIQQDGRWHGRSSLLNLKDHAERKNNLD